MSDQPSRPDPNLRCLPVHLEVAPLEDYETERYGFHPTHPYIENVWLGVLGPTSTWLYRRLGMWAAMEPSGLTVDMVDLGVSLGVGEGLHKNSVLAKSVGRLAIFHAAEWQDDTLAVRRALPPVPDRQLRKLSLSALTFHEQTLGVEASRG